MVDGYYGQPLLKAPVWTWEVPAYFFAGGAAGIAAAIAAVGAIAGADPSLVRDARWVAAAGAIISPALLISDLGRPSRFLNMFRVFKVQSAMSMGAWTLALFTPSLLVSLLWGPGGLVLDPPLALRIAGHAASIASALTGLVLATYTGVLLGVSAIPVWAAHATSLPVHFAASSLGAAVSILELVGHRTPAMNALGIAAALALTVAAARIEIGRRPASKPLTSGRSGLLTRLGDVLSGPVPLVLRLVWAGAAPAHTIAAVAAITGSLVTRFGWIAAGKASILVTLGALVAGPAMVGAQKPDLSTKALVAAASKYVAGYQEQFKFLLADEAYAQTTLDAAGELTRQRRMKGELFVTYLPGDAEWIAVHDIAEVDGVPVKNRDDLRLLLQKDSVRGIAARIAHSNAQFNIGRLGRNFNEPTLPLLLLGAKRVKSVSFERRSVIDTGGRTVVVLGFTERERPTLVRSAGGRPLYAKGTLTIDAITGRIERTEFEIKDSGVLSRLTTEYEPDAKLGLWVPTVFWEQYDDSRGGAREIIRCEARYTNYRRFDVTAKIK